VYNCGLTVRNKRICCVSVHGTLAKERIAAATLQWNVEDINSCLLQSLLDRQQRVCKWHRGYRRSYSMHKIKISRHAYGLKGWLGSRVVSVLDSGAVGPGFKSQSRRCRATVQTVHDHRASVHKAAKIGSSSLKGCEGNCRPGGK